MRCAYTIRIDKLEGKNSVGDLGVEGWNRSVVVCFNLRDAVVFEFRETAMCLRTVSVHLTYYRSIILH